MVKKGQNGSMDAFSLVERQIADALTEARLVMGQLASITHRKLTFAPYLLYLAAAPPQICEQLNGLK